MKVLFCIAISLCICSCTSFKKEKDKNEASQPIRGVWLTNVASEVLNSKENIKKAVLKCDSLGFNHIYVVTWNDARTTYPSKIMSNLIGHEIQEEFAGRDPLAELIAEAHAKGIKVHAWFEFGFSCSYKKADGGAILKQRPHWASRDRNGKLGSKNNFQWMNAFHPEVQTFMSDLVMEVVNNYDIDGIQGDDRMPAQPSTVGYDSLTVSIYQSEHSGKNPPDDYKDYEWVKWRSAKLIDWLSRLTKEVRAKKPHITISMAPSIYPWSEQEYLQDWPTWVNMGLVDMIIPQIYRYQVDRYEYELQKIVTQQIPECKKPTLAAGILLQVDNYNPTPGMLDSMIMANRKHGVAGEVFFFYEGIGKYKDYFMKNK